ncbi:hypothetical protein [Paenibacillus sp. Root52]|uniref:hypothetical protein n=1 Tax=Paenibacillus sp. Root52 TaxID=1736552 RepID=UPI000AB55F93|nr:hypothetical protein [Paenibacillus sp. Root52]
MTNETNIEFTEQMKYLAEFFKRIMERGMDGYAGAVWPVVVRQWHDKDVYMYPQIFFRNLARKYNVYVNPKTKSNRADMLKFLLDELMEEKINIHLYHFGLHLLYPYISRANEEKDKEGIGKKRNDFLSKLPGYELKSNDDFVSEVWSSLILRRYPDVGEEMVEVPSFNQLRILFTTEEFGNQTGMYFGDADWVEPIPALRLKVTKWVGEKDPMTPEAKKDGMIEGRIWMGHHGSNDALRHFVEGVPIHSGSYIEVKFGDGWIKGRYEWSFEQSSPISSRSESFNIQEGHLVRIRG